MTLQECYAMLCGNYDEARSRLMSDSLIEKFVLKFPQDPTMQNLRDALSEEDYETAFRAAHTLKGVAANLAFSSLQEVASNLTEQLRAEKKKPDDALLEKVEEKYALVIEAIKNFQNARD